MQSFLCRSQAARRACVVHRRPARVAPQTPRAVRGSFTFSTLWGVHLPPDFVSSRGDTFTVQCQVGSGAPYKTEVLILRFRPSSATLSFRTSATWEIREFSWICSVISCTSHVLVLRSESLDLFSPSIYIYRYLFSCLRLASELAAWVRHR